MDYILKLFNKCKRPFCIEHAPKLGALDIFKYIGPGLLVTVGFIDPGNWASNIAAGSMYGYTLLWMVTLSTIMLILLQHNAAHLGIATGLCISEAATKYLPKPVSRGALGSAVLAAISTALAEILGGAIALNMLFHIPIKLGAVLVTLLVAFMLFSNSYKRLEKVIIGFVSIIGISFIYELSLVHLDWMAIAPSWVTPSFPAGAMPIIMSVLGAVVMPHNLFLHSEIIQSRQWNHENEKLIKKQLDYEFLDTLFAMGVGWAINSAMIILAAAAFFYNKIEVTEIQQAGTLLEPLLGTASAIVFAIALLFAGVSSSLTAAMAGSSIFAGIFSEPYDITDIHTKAGVLLTFIPALVIIFLISNPFNALIISQMMLSIQLPITIFLQVYLTSSGKVMGKYRNKLSTRIMLVTVGLIVTALNVMLLWSYVF